MPAGPAGNITPAELYTSKPKNGQRVEIPEGADLNFAPEEAQEARPAGFSEEVYSSLPELLRSPCDALKNPEEKEVFLVGALCTISGILPNVRGFYDQEYYGPNLYGYIVGPYGSGKGTLKLAHALAWPVHKEKKGKTEQALIEYEQELEEWKANKKKGKEPPKPPQFLLFIPANSSKSGLVELLESNGNRGIVFETEGDTLADALKTDYGNFSDILRKAFHHEPITFYRRTEKEYKEVETPHLSVTLSSTFDQLQKLIPTVENGLFSRFLFYWLTPNREFRDVFNRDRQILPRYFKRLGEEYLKVFQHLEALPEPLEFDFSAHQQAQFMELFAEWKQEIGELVSNDLEGTVNRLGLIAFRLAMILTTIRAFEVGEATQVMVCEDQDFYNALRIVETLKGHALKVFYQLPRPSISKEAGELEKELHSKANQISLCRQMHQAGDTYAEIALKVLGDAGKKGTVYKWLNYK